MKVNETKSSNNPTADREVVHQKEKKKQTAQTVAKKIMGGHTGWIVGTHLNKQPVQ